MSLVEKEHIDAVTAAGSAVVEAYKCGVVGDALAQVALEVLSARGIKARASVDRVTVALVRKPNNSFSMQIAGTEIGDCVGVEIPIEKLTRAD